MRARSDTAGSEFDAGPEYRPSDQDLGIGVDDRPAPVPPPAAAADALAELLKTPEIAAAVEALVAARLKEAAGAPAPAAPAVPDQMAQFVALIVNSLDKHASVHGQQQPGYFKPLPAAEVEARMRAVVEMQALLSEAESAGERPIYLLKSPFYAQEILWPEGDTIYWFGPPSVEMVPQNDAARRISEQMWRSIGGTQTPIETQVADAIRERNNSRIGSTSAPETPLFREPNAGASEHVGHVAGVERQNVRPSRAAGTLVPEISTVGTVQPGALPSRLQSF